jgi:hypothetical protein
VAAAEFSREQTRIALAEILSRQPNGRALLQLFDTLERKEAA